MKVKCFKCGLVYRSAGFDGEKCPKCGSHDWTMSGIEYEKLNKTEEIDDMYMATINFLVREWLKKKGYMYSEKMAVPHDYLEILKDLLQQMNKDYRDFIEKHLLAGLPIDPIEFSKFYQSQLERIMNIKI